MMVRKEWLLLVFLSIGTVVLSAPTEIGDRAQLFIDPVLVRETSNVCFTQHPGVKHPESPLIKADQPWEGWRIELFGTVLYDEEERQFKMWYVNDQQGFFQKRYNTCYATSKDGIHWEKPTVGTLQSLNGQPHAVVGMYETCNVFKDYEEPDPNRRYKMIAYVSEGPTGYRTLVSPDGLHWNVESQEPIAPNSDVIGAFWDHYRKGYVAYPKIGEVSPLGHKRRVFDVIFSDDFRTWTEPQPAFRPDLRDDEGSYARLVKLQSLLDRPVDPNLMRTEFYGMGFYRQESCIIGFPWIFTINNNARWGNQDGVQEIQLAVSRDGISWERPFRLPIIEMGEFGEWDCSYHMTASRAIRVRDEIRLYYSGANYTHGTPAVYRDKDDNGNDTGRGTKYTSRIGLVTWKLDRFVSADGPQEGGTLTTIPFVFSGDRLVINALTRKEGAIVVELLDAAGNRLEGYSRSDVFFGDELRHVVTFGGKTDLSRLVDKAISLRFHLRNAELYSFAFRKSSG